jgi:hypothetical protein
MLRIRGWWVAGIIVIAIALIAAIPLTGLWIVNARLLPGAAARMERSLEDTCGCEVSLATLRWRPVRGIQVTGAALSLEKPKLSLEAARVDVDVSWRTLRRYAQIARGRRKLPDPEPTEERSLLATGSGLPYREEVAAALRGIALAADAELLPESIMARDVVITAVPAGPLEGTYRFTLDSAVVSHESDSGTVQISSVSSQEGALEVAIVADYAGEEMEVSLSHRDLRIPSIAGSRISTADSLLSTAVTARLPADGTLALMGSARIEDFALESPVIAPGTIHPLSLSLDFDLDYDPTVENPDVPSSTPYSIRRFFPRGVINLNDSTVRVNGVELSVRGVLSGVRTAIPHPVTLAPAGMPRRINLEVELAKTSLAEINRAIPGALKGGLETIEVGGDFAWHVIFDFARFNPLGLQWTAKPELERFSIRGIARELNPFGLNGAFVHTIRDPQVGYHRNVLIPPADLEAEASLPPGSPEPDPSFVYRRLEEISPMVSASVITAEDGAFYYHDGVNFRTLAHAVVRNLSAGEVQVGASTITMQLAKMLFLSDERIFARKLQEVFLVYLMEHQVPVSKDRILEIYLNIAEFGPGVFGIHDAAEYYFATDAGDLDVGQATFLASILPSPKRYHWYYDQGEISDGWFIRMKSYYDIMLRRGRMTQEEYEEAIEEKPAFAKPPGIH